MSSRYNLRGKRNPEVDGSSSSNVDTASTSDEPLPDPSTAQKTKRARTSPATSETSRKKDLNTKQNALRGLAELPIEIFTEITLLTQPRDLLSLARCCKSFRGMLMKSSVAHIWRSAESNVEGLPGCPEGMCAPQYAALLFTKSCTSCGTTTSSRADPFLRVRLCSECREIELIVAKVSWRWEHYDLELVPITKLMKFKLKNAGRRMYGGGPTEYCLTKEADEILLQYRQFAAAHSADLVKLCRLEQHASVQERHLFGLVLNEFMLSAEQAREGELQDLKAQRREVIKERMRGLGWSDLDLDFRGSSVQHQWRMHLDQPKPISDRSWEKLLPQLVSLLEVNRRDRSKREKEKRTQERRKHVHALLQDLKLQINPFQRLISDLGFNPAQPPDASENDLAILKALEDYPFPHSATVLEAHCFDDLHDADFSIEKVEELFYERQDQVEENITEWREQGEQQLVNCWKAGGGNAPSTINRGNTEFLLRADTIFSYDSPEEPDGQRSLERYPNIVRDNSTYSDHQGPSEMFWAWRQFYRHAKAEKITRAILGRHDMPDVTYYGLKVLGSVFVCERCEDKEPKTWDEILEHYIEEAKTWRRQSLRDPIIKTSNPIPLRDIHDAAAMIIPFVRLLGDGDKEPISTPTLNLSKSLDCLLCKNRHHRRTLANLEDMKKHLHNVHGVSYTWETLMYESSTNVDCFHERTNKWKMEWKRDWDNYCKAYM